MASKGRRDVDLVIRAKNEASKFIDAVSSSLNDLTKAQSGTADGARKTESTLGQLGSELGKLTKVFTSAVDASKRLESSAQDMADEQARLTAEIEKSEQALAGLNKTQMQAEGNLKRRQGWTDRARKSQQEYNQTLREARTEASKAARVAATRETALNRQTAAVEKARAAVSAATKIAVQDNQPTSAQVAKIDRLTQALDRQLAKHKELRAALAEAQRQARSTASNQARAESRAAKLAARYDEQKTKTAAAAAELKNLNTQTSVAAAQVTKLRGESESLTQSLSQQTGRLESVRAEMQSLSQQTAESATNMAKLGSVAGGSLNRELITAQKRLVEFKQQWKEATAAISASVAAGGNTAQPSPQLASQMRQASEAKDAYLGLRNAIHQTRQAMLQAAKAAGQETAEITASGNAADRAAAGNRRFANTLDLLAKNSRKSMTWMQRVRSEVTALATAYVGLFASIQQAGQVVEAIRTVQGAENKLAVAFGQDQAKIKSEMDWLHSEALRLGASFQDLVKQYADFSVAVEQSDKLAGKTRELFQPFIEAGTVLHLTKDQMNLVFLALSQMVNKGIVSMEELKRQMGDQVAGAFELAAKSMGLTGAELSKIVSTGQLMTSTFLPKFAKRIKETFGPQVPEAVQLLNAQLGRLQTRIFDMRLAVAKGGFMEGLTDAVKELNDFFSSAAGESTFEGIGAAAGALLRLLAEMVKHLDAITMIFEVWAARKFTGLFVAFGKDLGVALKAAKAMPAVLAASTASLEREATAATVASASWRTLGVQLGTARTRLMASIASFNAARAASAALTGAIGLLRGALAALGGIPGLIITGLTFALTAWLTRTKDVTSATDELTKAVDGVRKAYDQADKSANDFLDTVKKATQGDLIRALQKASEKMAEMRNDTPAIPGGSTGIYSPQPGVDRGPTRLAPANQELNRIAQAFRKGELSAKQYKEALSDLLVQFPEMDDRLKDAWDRLNKTADAAVDLSEKTDTAQAALAYLSGTATDAQKKLLPWVETQTQAATATDDISAAIEKVIGSLEKYVPSLKAASDRQKELAKVDTLVSTFLKLHQDIDKTSDAYLRLMDTARRAREEIEKRFQNQTLGSLADRIIAAESSGKASASNPNSSAYGAGQFIASTWLRMMKQYLPMIAKGKSDTELLDLRKDMRLNRELVVKYAEENRAVLTGPLSKLGEKVNDTALYLAHFLGAGGALKLYQAKAATGGATPVSQVLSQRAIAANPNVLGGGKTVEEVVEWARKKIDLSKEDLALQKHVHDLENKKAEKAKAFHTQLANNLEIEASQNAVAKKRTLQEEINVAVLKAQNQAKKAGTTLTQAEHDQIVATTTELYKQKHAQDDLNAAKKESRELHKQTNDLQQVHNALVQEAQLALQNGDTGHYDQLRAQLDEVNAQLKTAIQNEIAFWQSAAGALAAGSPDAATAQVLRLQSALRGVETEAARAKVAMLGLTTGEIAEALRSNLTSAIDGFLDKIYETGLSFQSLGDAFRQFAADFLRQIAKMILQQAIFNALQAAGKSIGGPFGSILSLAGGATHHTGGVVGASAARRRAMAGAWFNNAVRYHSGGIAGLAPNEVPAVLQKGEEVLTRDDPRHRANGGGLPAGGVKIVNAIDAGDFVSKGMDTVPGQQAIFNFMKANSQKIKGILG